MGVENEPRVPAGSPEGGQWTAGHTLAATEKVLNEVAKDYADMRARHVPTFPEHQVETAKSQIMEYVKAMPQERLAKPESVPTKDRAQQLMAITMTKGLPKPK